MRERAHAFVPVALGLAAALALTSLALFVCDHTYSLYDDAFIYLRYVKTAYAGCGLRWNCNEPPVEGFSGPLYLAILLCVRAFTHKMVTATEVIGVASMA